VQFVWYQVLWHFVVETALINSYIAYNMENPSEKLTPRQFRVAVAQGILKYYNNAMS